MMPPFKNRRSVHLHRLQGTNMKPLASWTVRRQSRWPAAVHATRRLPVLQRRVAHLQRRDRQLAGGVDRQAGRAAPKPGRRCSEQLTGRGQGQVRDHQDSQGRERAGRSPQDRNGLFRR